MKTLQSEMQRIETIRGQINVLRAEAEAILDGIEKQIVGRTIEGGFARLAGKYQITDVRLNWDNQIEAHGRKVTSGGKLGSQRWDIGTVYPGRLDLCQTEIEGNS